MSDTQNDTILAALRTRQRDLELDACAVRARVEEVAELIALLEHRRRPGRPRKSNSDLMQLCPDGVIRPVEMPQRVEGAAHEQETQETAA